MMHAHVFETGREFLIRLKTGDDLLTSLTDFAKNHGVRAGWINYLGAISHASLRYYNQNDKAYEDFDIEGHLEVLAGIGNISELDGEPFVHTHIAVADRDGKGMGGHVNVGTTVFAIEVRIEEILGDPPERVLDELTGLSLWGGTL
ncbi:MAG: DNA-binding protein [Acidimicrobiia bacterium]|nr:DNA-binding protein [Acidimicrobiia bacterium]